MDEPKKKSRKKKILIGLGIYMVVAVIASVIAVNSESAKKTAEEAEAEAAAKLAEMDAIYNSHDPETFLRYALDAAEKQERIVVASVQPDVYTCIVEADISGYVYSMSDDGADADGMVAAACLFVLDCSDAMFKADEHIEQIFYYFRVKNKLGSWLESAVTLVINRAECAEVDYNEFRKKLQNDYNEIKKIARMMTFSGQIEQRLKNYHVSP